VTDAGTAGERERGRTPDDGSRGRIAGLDGLRAVAALAIVVFHVWTTNAPYQSVAALGPATLLLPPLREGVTLFFCLSGFLLYLPFASALIRGSRRPSSARYALRRLLRIAPAYWFVLLVTVLTLEPRVRLSDAGDLSILGRQALLLANDAPGTIWSGLTPSWSLAVELVFYLVLPVLAAAAFAQVRRGRSGATAAWMPPAALLAVGVIGKLSVALFTTGAQDSTAHSWHAVLDASFLTHADLFSFGMAVAVVHVLVREGRVRPPLAYDPLVCRTLVYAGIPALFVGYYVIPAYGYHTLTAALAALLVARIVILAPAAPTRGLLLRTLERPAFVYLGAISYSVFLWNSTLSFLLFRHHLLARSTSAWGLLLDMAVVTTLTIAVSALTYRFVEQPFMRLRVKQPAPRRSGRMTVSLPARAAVFAPPAVPVRARDSSRLG
jgi:peptidoglycan/LPS O-acetylase OafA/YrhL